MPRSHEEPEYDANFWHFAPMEQPPGPIHDFDTMVGYILGDRAAQAREIMAKDIEREMVLAGFNAVSRKTTVAWVRSDSDLPERLARDGIMPHPSIPKMFTKYLRTYPGLARMGQPGHDFGISLAGLIKIGVIVAGVIIVARQTSKPTEIPEKPKERRANSRIGRVSRGR